MTPARWDYLKNLRPGFGTYLHTSCDVAMLPNPEPGLPSIPWIGRSKDTRGAVRGHTYSVGRNKAKRERRALRGVRK